MKYNVCKSSDFFKKSYWSDPKLSLHSCKPTHKLISMNTEIIVTENIRSKLAIKEEFLIKKLNPSINR